MTTEHDEALVERVALAICNARRTGEKLIPFTSFNQVTHRDYWCDDARAVIYPPAPPKTRLQVARELLAAGFDSGTTKESILNGYSDSGASIEAILAALALPAMED